MIVAAPSLHETRSMLATVPADIDRGDWVRVLMSIKSEFPDADGLDLARVWSQGAASFNERALRDTWRSIKASGGVGIGSLVKLAKQHGWRAAGGLQPTIDPGELEQRQQRRAAVLRAEQAREARLRAAAALRAHAIWRGCSKATSDHPYLARKQVKPHQARVYRGPLQIGGQQCHGALVVPIHSPSGEMVSLQFVAEDGQKKFLPYGRTAGCYASISGVGRDRIVICEGFATAASINEATGLPVAVALSAGNMKGAALALREKYQGAELVLAADAFPLATVEKARQAAAAVHGLLSVPSLQECEGTDFNDLAGMRGLATVRAAIDSADQIGGHHG